MTMTRSRLRTLCLAALSCTALSACLGDMVQDEPTQGVASESLVEGQPVSVVRSGSGKCLDVYAAATSNGSKLNQWACNGTPAQTFVFENRGGGVYRIQNPNSGKCLTLAGSANADGTEIQITTCSTSSTAQRFRVESVANGFEQVVNVRSGKCLDVSAASNADGAKVQIWSCNGTGAQAWKIGASSGGDGDGDGDGDGELVWRRANLTWFESYPDPGSEECTEFNGCLWSGYFAFVDGKQSEQWVSQHNILAVHSRDADAYKLKTLRLRQGGRTIDATVYDMCSDRDCSGCCTQNASETGFLIDIESYTRDRFGSGSGIVEWACLDC